MKRVLVIANDSLLADAILSDLTQDISLEVHRLRQYDSDQAAEALHEDCSVVIIVEEGDSSRGSMTASDLLRNDRCLRIIIVSPKRHHLHVYDGYELPVSGMAQVVHLAKDFTREQLNGATK